MRNIGVLKNSDIKKAFFLKLLTGTLSYNERDVFSYLYSYL